MSASSGVPCPAPLEGGPTAKAKTVTLVEYRPAWPEDFRHAAAELRAVFTGRAVAVEHIGSTAVPGLCAKPVVDIMLGVPALSEVEARAAGITALGYLYRPEYEVALPERRYFVRAEGHGPRLHLHAVVEDGPLWRRHIAFRDALRRDPALARRYRELKRRLATVHANDRLAYTNAKGGFIARVLAAEALP